MGNNSFGIDFSAFGNAMKDLQNAYSDGLGAMNQAGEEVAENMVPSHKIIIDCKLSANVESHPYKVDAHLEFEADLDSILNAESGDIGALLSGLNVGLSDEEQEQVAEQLGKPRCIAVLKDSTINSLELHSNEGKIKEGINKKATMLISLEGEKISFSFESAFALPKLQAVKTIYSAIPSQEEMQKNIVINKKNLDKKIHFNWTEKNKDNLKIEGTLIIKKI
ncbi:hypothetical protein JW758_02915 [Candidatus Peregrinibacteria bacterium]|nr:hypothetical protein [Candidatus Peregrinibacteria bacterium]